MRHTLDRKLAIEYGYSFNGADVPDNYMAGAMAYQKALNRWQAEQNKKPNDDGESR